ncbi:Ig-like domain-containing protein [Kitasatospora sp. NPDC058444]|uniref:Ig-like domain-containing protein n=1 Tax=Kitasatospora sp. NPDC058444 TaxID=3346504 RepID=UPI00364E1242
MSRQFSRTAGALAVLATGLLTMWNAPLSMARQSPDAWSAEHRAVLPSGLSVRFDFDAAPGTGVTAEPGELADRSDAGRPAVRYTDGMRAGDPAQTFGITPDRPQADGSWRTVGTLRLDFSRPVRNPRLHLSGLAALATGDSGTTSTATRLTLTGGSPAAPVLVDRTDWPGWTLDGNALAPASPDGATDGDPGSAAEGSLELAGTVRTAVFRVEQRSVARAGSTTAPPVLHQAYTVTVDEGLGTAPQDYGNASHVVSDLFLGSGAAQGADRFQGSGAAQGSDAAGGARGADRGRAVEAPGSGPLVRLDHGAGRRSPFADPQSMPRPGRAEYQGADPSIAFPAEAAIGRYYRLTVPVAVGDQPATLAGWIDFGHTGRFDPAERVQTEVPPGAATATLEWTVPSGAASGETWARLRIGRDAGQLVSSGGFADSGQVSDQRIALTVGAARPEIAEPVEGAVLADARPRISGGGAVSGATVEVREGDTPLCEAVVRQGGDWSCRPGSALAAGPHALTPVETTSGGVVLRGEPVRVSVKTVPPGTPALTVPAYTNDPGLRLTGTGEAGSTVWVVDQASGDDLCIIGVPADGRWSCLPVENLTEGKHLLSPVAVDVTGNRTPGPAVELVVDTGLPERPVLVSPAPGETVRGSRPKLAGRAGPGSNVLVTVQGGADSEAERRTVLCGATAAFDGSWSCTANRDLADGDQWLLVTATDPAGNVVSAEPVPVRVATAGAVPDPTVPSPVPPGAVPPSSVPQSPAVAQSPAVPGPVPQGPAVPGPVVQSPPAVGSTASAAASGLSSPVAGSPTRPATAQSSPTASTPSTASGPAASPAASHAAPSPAPPSPVAPSSLAEPSKPAEPRPSALRSAVASASRSVAADPIAGPPAGARTMTVDPVTTASAAAGPSAAASGAPKARPIASTLATAQVTSGSVASTRSAPPIPSTTATVTSSPAPATGVGTSPAAVPAGKSPSSPAGSAGPADAAQAAAPAAPAAPAESAESAESVQGAARPLAAPPAEAVRNASGRPGEAGWRGGLAGVLLVLTGLGLITRRVVARRAGASRR